MLLASLLHQYVVGQSRPGRRVTFFSVDGHDVLSPAMTRIF